MGALLGVLSFFAIFVFLGIGFWKKIRKSESKKFFTGSLISFIVFVLCFMFVEPEPEPVNQDVNTETTDKKEGNQEKVKENANENEEKKRMEQVKKEEEEEDKVKKEQEAKLKAEQVKKEEEVLKKKEQAEQDKIQSLGMNIDEFKKNFNTISNEVQTGFKINQLLAEEGSVQNVFQYQLTKNAFIQGTINKRTGDVREVSMLAQGDGSSQSGVDMLLIMGTLIRSSDLSMTPDESGEIISELIGDDFNVDDYDAHTVRNGIKYSIMTSSAIGIMFIISNANDK